MPGIPTFSGAYGKYASGVLGNVVTIQHNEILVTIILPTVTCGGNWKDSETSGPLAITKSCHDMNILLYLLEKATRKRWHLSVVKLFRPENYDPSNGSRCVDCPQQQTCPLLSREIYSSEKSGRYVRYIQRLSRSAKSGRQPLRNVSTNRKQRGGHHRQSFL